VAPVSVVPGALLEVFPNFKKWSIEKKREKRE
jgi:hypothetical protein